MTAPTPIWATFVRTPDHGPLPVLLLLLTTATGLVDAVSILGLGRVFVANMTGNIVFLGFAIAGAPGFSLLASLAALLGFLVGAFVGGSLVRRFGAHRGRLLGIATAVEVGLVLVAVVLAAVLVLGDVAASVLAALLAVAMGIQNSAARRLAVPDLTTTVLTMTLTGIAADVRRSGAATVVRRVLAVLTMFAGAGAGALLVAHLGLAWALAPALLLLGVVAVVATLASRTPQPWHTRD